MILIMSDENDVSTNHVINWLLHLKIPYFRINDTSSVYVDYLTTRNGELDFKLSITSPYLVKPYTIFANNITAYWYRRGFLVLEKLNIPEKHSKKINLVGEKFNEYFFDENKKIVDFFHKYFTTIPHLGCFLDNTTINKIYILYQAQKTNLLIPEFMLTRKKSELTLFMHKHAFCITKGIARNGFNIMKDIGVGNLAKLVTASELPQIPATFNYSFIQQYIDKKADIRVFYLDGKIYSTAIFSQNDEQTKIDFRNYNEENPNRIIPFKLPDHEEKKLKKLMRNLDYQTGSIDYVLDKNNDLYFLEINPIGQYDFISYKCNLFLDKAICNYFKAKTG